MRRTAQRDALIAEVKARQRAAGQKVSRLERRGVQIGKAGLDPRTESTAALQNMSSRQLRSYMARLDRFTSRSNGYVAGVQGTPIQAGAFREYKRLEKNFNAKAAAYEAAIGGIAVPGTGMTIDQRKSILAQGPRAGGDFRTFQQLNRDAKNLTGDAAVKKYIAAMQKKLNPKYLSREMTQQRKIIKQMLSTSGDTEVQATIDKLNDTQLNTLVGYTPFMTNAGARYAMAQSISSDTPRWQSQAYEAAGDRLQELAAWAADLPADTVTDGGTGTKPRSPRSRRVSFTPGLGDFNPKYS